MRIISYYWQMMDRLSGFRHREQKDK